MDPDGPEGNECPLMVVEAMGVPEVGDFWKCVGVGGLVVQPEAEQPEGAGGEVDVVIERFKEVLNVRDGVGEYFTFFETVAD